MFLTWECSDRKHRVVRENGGSVKCKKTLAELLRDVNSGLEVTGYVRGNDNRKQYFLHHEVPNIIRLLETA